MELGHHAIDAGADLVFGHHPHVMQGIEVYRGRPIFYSLGNFTFARHNPEKGHELETMIVRCKIVPGKIQSLEYLPARCDDQLDPHVLDLNEGREAIALVAQRSEQFGTWFQPMGDAIRVHTDAARTEAAA